MKHFLTLPHDVGGYLAHQVYLAVNALGCKNTKKMLTQIQDYFRIQMWAYNLY